MPALSILPFPAQAEWRNQQKETKETVHPRRSRTPVKFEYDEPYSIVVTSTTSTGTAPSLAAAHIRQCGSRSPPPRAGSEHSINRNEPAAIIMTPIKCPLAILNWSWVDNNSGTPVSLGRPNRSSILRCRGRAVGRIGGQRQKAPVFARASGVFELPYLHYTVQSMCCTYNNIPSNNPAYMPSP